jgi:hypothetical protein
VQIGDLTIGGIAMKSTILLALAVALFASLPAIAQDKPDPAIVSTKPLVVSGRVSTDGKTLLTDIDSSWSVSNREALKGHEGRMVRVKCFVNTEKNSIEILTVKRDDSGSNYTAVRYSDSAFRR